MTGACQCLLPLNSKANLVVNKNNWLCKPGKFQQFFNQEIWLVSCVSNQINSAIPEEKNLFTCPTWHHSIDWACDIKFKFGLYEFELTGESCCVHFKLILFSL